MTCARCGASIAEPASFCPNCGASLEGAAPPVAAAVHVSQAGAEPPAPLPAFGAAPPVAPAAGMPLGSYGTGAALPAAPVYGGFWRRLWALVLDVIILNIITIPINLIVGGPNFADLLEPDPSPERIMAVLSHMGALMFFVSLVQWIYFGFLESSQRQATLGKMALGLRVTDMQGRRISFARATGRYFAHYITACTFLIGYIIQLFTQKRQALHDIIAGTLVVRDRT